MPFCRKCGSRIEEGEKFCTQCGTSVTLDTSKSRERRIITRQRSPISVLAIVLTIIVVVSMVSISIIAVFLGFWQPFGQIIGSGNLISEEKVFTDFSNVEIGWGFEAEINQSNSYSIRITADDNMFKNIKVSKTGNTLKIGLELGYSYRSLNLRVEITMPDLQKITLSGGSQCTVGGFSSSGEFNLALSGGSSIMLDGSSDNILISASGGSQLDLSSFQVHDANINLSGGSIATVLLDGRLDANLSGGSQLWYIGDPTMGNIRTSGGSLVQEK